MTPRLVKSVAEWVASSDGVLSAGRKRRRNRVLVLAYHNVIPDQEVPSGDASLHLPCSTFAAQLDRLERTHRIVDLEQAFRDPDDEAGNPRAVITFDDGYRGAVTLALPELARRGLPATMFLVPGAVGQSGFWWDRYAPEGGSWDDRVRSELLTRCAGQSESIDEWARGRGLEIRAWPASLGVATETELREAAQLPGVRFGSHSWSHPNLAAFAPAAAGDEIATAQRWVEERFDNSVRWLSYPYGLSSPAVERIAEELGFEGAMQVTGGWWPPPDQARCRFRLPRWNVPAGISPAGFEIRAAGYWCR
jgi:peptidoglycan/xylan/chitin deacetylase (PgdA/CDA1 family)